MAIDLAKDYPLVGNTENGNSIRSVIFGFADDPHLAARCAARESQSIPHNHANFVLEQDADSLSAFAER
jgi:hypothetical protein